MSNLLPVPPVSRLRGVTLIELMVALTIGLIVTLVLFSALQTFEGRKRTTVSVNDIDQAGNWAAYALDKWVRSAGSGFAEAAGETYGCKLTAAKGGVQILPRTSALPAPFASVTSGTTNVFKLIPFLILPGQTTPSVSGQASDVLLVMAGTSGAGETATQFSAVPTNAQLNLITGKGFSANDLVLITDLSSAPTGSPCLIEQVASPYLFSTATPTELPLNTSGAYYAAIINSTGITSFVDTLNDAAINLGNVANGNSPVFLVLGVGDQNTLFGYDLLQSQNSAGAPFAVADGVFELHALYGIDTNGDNKVDSWVEATDSYAPSSLTDGTAAALSRIKSIKAVRIGMILRTSLPEKTQVTGSTLTLFSDLAVSYTRTLSSAERYFRYRTVDTTIPLRNAVMVSSVAP